MYEFNVYGPDTTGYHKIFVAVPYDDAIWNQPEKLRLKFFDDYLYNFISFIFPVKLNFGVIDGGEILYCMYGETSEVNNQILQTYSLHEKFQSYPCLVKKSVHRNNINKLKNLFDLFYQFILKTNKYLSLKINKNFFRIVDKCNFTKVKFLPWVDGITQVRLWKDIAYNLSITYALFEGTEIYKYDDIIAKWPFLNGFFNEYRLLDLFKLTQLKNNFILLIKGKADTYSPVKVSINPFPDAPILGYQKTGSSIIREINRQVENSNDSSTYLADKNTNTIIDNSNDSISPLTDEIILVKVLPGHPTCQ